MTRTGLQFLLLMLLSLATLGQGTQRPRIVGLTAADGTPLKATFFPATKSGPGVLLLHQINRDRKSWDPVAAQLAAAGINTLTLDMRGFGESGGTSQPTGARPGDVDVALQYLTAQPGVNQHLIGVGGAGWFGVRYAVDAARRHPEEIKSLVLMSGETSRDGLQFLHQASQLPELFVFSDDDEYPPTQDAMQLLYVTASSPSMKLVHYSEVENAPWLWYEDSSGKVPAHGGHGTDMFKVHPELPGIIVHWFVTTLVRTPGHAPADGLAAAPILNQLQTPGGAAQVTQRLLEARRKDPQAQLWPEVAVDIIGADYQRADDVKNAIEVFKLNLLAYPDSADAHYNLADAYLADGQKDLARQYAEKALAVLDSHKAPLSSWSDTEERRTEIRRSMEHTFAQATSGISAIAISGQQVSGGGSSPPDTVYARPGQLVDAGGFRLNLHCMGSGSPTVVFDSGWGDWAPAWSKVQPLVAKWTRACSYDRAGTGFSDPGPMPRTSMRIAKELRTALNHAGIGGPYIMVGHAFGGDNVRTFADLYMDEVAGLVLDDADPNDLEPQAMREEEHRGQARIPADLRDCRNLIAEHKPLPARAARQGPPQTCAQRFFFRGLPEAEWSPELNAKLLEIAQTKVALYDAYASEMEQTSADEIYLQQHRRSFGSRPIRVLTSGNHGVGHLERKPPDTPEHLKYEQETTAAQARWLSVSSNSKQIFAHHSSEYIQFDEPETVNNAIREVYDQAEKPVVAGNPADFRDRIMGFRVARALPKP